MFNTAMHSMLLPTCIIQHNTYNELWEKRGEKIISVSAKIKTNQTKKSSLVLIVMKRAELQVTCVLYLHEKEVLLSKELAYTEISLPWGSCYCTEAASRLPAKLFDNSASESDPAAREISFKA